MYLPCSANGQIFSLVALERLKPLEDLRASHGLSTVEQEWHKVAEEVSCMPNLPDEVIESRGAHSLERSQSLERNGRACGIRVSFIIPLNSISHTILHAEDVSVSVSARFNLAELSWSGRRT